MFENFLSYFDVNETVKSTGKLYADFVSQLGGRRFGNGIFNTFTAEEVVKWTEIVSGAYPKLRNMFKLFGYTWMGDCYAIDLRKGNAGNVLLFEIGTGYILKIPCTFEEFLEQEISADPEAILAKSFFDEWMLTSKKAIQPGNCVGYKVPLFLGGQEELHNLEEGDMEVYWTVVGQVKNQVGQ